jgi:hypothetical protein
MINEILAIILAPVLIGMIIGMSISPKNFKYGLRITQIGAAFMLMGKGFVQMKVSLEFALIPMAIGSFMMGIGIPLVFKHSRYTKEQAKIALTSDNSEASKDTEAKNRHISVLNKYNPKE